MFPLRPLRVLTALTAVAAGLFLAAGASAAPAPSLPPQAGAASDLSLPELSIEQIVQRNADARGGLAAWRAVQTLSFKGSLDAGQAREDGGQAGKATSRMALAQVKARLRQNLQTTGTPDPEARRITLPFQLDMKRPAMTRLEIPFEGQTAVQVYDGVNGWKLRPYLGRHEVEPFSAEELKSAAAQQPIDGPLIDHVAKGTRIERDGAERVEGRPAYRLKLTLRNGDVRHLWVDAQSFLELRIDNPPRMWNGRSHPVLTYFRDYRSVQGLQIAHRLDTVIEGLPGARAIRIEQVALNPVLADQRFGRPE